MPGTKDVHPFKRSWFQDTFGFVEEACRMDDEKEMFLDAIGADRKRKIMGATRERFSVEGDTLISKGGEDGKDERRFHAGPFEVCSLKELRARSDKLSVDAKDKYWKGGSLTFRNTEETKTCDLYKDPENAGAVFQSSSLFNCLETTPMGVEPEDGVTDWWHGQTQGATSSLSCPAAAVFRTYLCNDGAGQTEENQVDCLSAAAAVVNNEEEGYWTLNSGFCMPKTHTSIQRLSAKLASDKALAEAFRSAVQVGVHWDTEVAGDSKHRVCQVLCSAMPVGVVKTVRTSEWQGPAELVLSAAYDATLTAAAILARQRGERVKVFLTLVGGGALGNRRHWIADALNVALGVHRSEPLDVELVHYSSIPGDGPCAKLEHGRTEEALAETLGPTRHLNKARLCKGTASQINLLQEEMEKMEDELKKKDSVDLREYHIAFEAFDKDGDGSIDKQEFADLSEWCKTHAERVAVCFGGFDMNGDGSIDRKEFADILNAVNPTFFTQNTIDLLMDEADADGDGEIHYAEFLAWLYEEDPMVMSKVLDTVKLYSH